MTLESIITIGATVITIVCAPFLYIWKTTMSRIDVLEAKVETKVSEQDVREILKDKLEPIREDVQQLNQKLDKIIDHLLKS